MSKLYLGAGREIITPEIGGQLYGYRPNIYSTSVEDDLTVTAFCFRYEEKIALMISATVCLIQSELCDRILSEIENKFDIPKSNCILHSIHNHSGPNTAGETGWGDVDKKYCDEIFIPGILSAVNTAKNKLEPVRMGMATGYSFVGVNRREVTLRNTTNLGQNPSGSFNPEMTVISFKNDNDDIVANIIHYGAHCTAAGLNTEITRDWPGPMIDALEKESGAITAFFNGAEGDIGPRLSNGQTVGNIGLVRELGKIAAEDAVGIYKKIKNYTDTDLSVRTEIAALPLEARLPLEEALEKLEKFDDNVINVHAKTKSYLENVVKSYEDGYEDKEAAEISQTMIKLGDVLFLAFPFELFTDIAARINRAEDCLVLSLSCSNGSEGYFVTQEQLIRGGYEVQYFKCSHLQNYVDDADWHLVLESLENIKKLKA